MVTTSIVPEHAPVHALSSPPALAAPWTARSARVAPTPSSPTCGSSASESHRARATSSTDLIETNAGVARSMAGRYRNRGIDLDDLEQVALLGLTKAAQSLRPRRRSRLPVLRRARPSAVSCAATSATPAGWSGRRAACRTCRHSSRAPRTSSSRGSVARRDPARSPRTSTSPSTTSSRPWRPTAASRPTSLDGPVGDGSSSLGDLLGCDDRTVEAAEARIVLEPVVRPLSPRDQRILRMRFVEERTQQEIAEVIGLTQAQVSRVLTRILAGLRADLVGRVRALARRLSLGVQRQLSKPSPAASSARRKTLRRPRGGRPGRATSG